MPSGVLIYAEQRDGRNAPVVAELLGIGRTLASALGEPLVATVLGNGVGNEVKQDLIARGADRVVAVDHALLQRYQLEPYVDALEKVVRHVDPAIFLLGQTFQCRDLAPRVAFRLGTGLCMDSVELSIEPETRLLVEIKPVYGGNARAEFVCEATRPQMATIRAKAFEAAAADADRRGQIESLAVEIDASRVRARLIEHTVAAATGALKLEDARIVVSGGRGFGSEENFQPLEELAAVLGGAVAASRGAVDAGYQPTERQVGLSGKVVTPDLYIAIAISGASQHMAGCASSKCIVAVNRDADAAIYKFAQFGVVSTWQQFLPAFTEKCRELLKD